MTDSPALMVIIGLLLAAWTAVAGWFMLRASARSRGTETIRRSARRLSRMIEESPAVPLLVRADGRIEAPERLAGWFGLDRMPEYLSELSLDGDGGLDDAQLETLTAHVRRTQKTAASFTMTLAPPGSRKALTLRGTLADPSVSPAGAALIWVFDFTESEGELAALREQAASAREDFGALVGLI